MAFIKVGTKLLHITFLADTGVRCIIAPKTELIYLEQRLSSDDAPTLLKREARKFLKKSPLTGAKREMTVKARGVLEEILRLKS